MSGNKSDWLLSRLSYPDPIFLRYSVIVNMA